MKRALAYIAMAFIIVDGSSPGFGQTWSLHGQASAWLLSHPEEPYSSQAGLRYIPELSLTEALGSGLTADLDLVLNGFAAGSYSQIQQPQYDAKGRLYRAWVRLASDKIEVRAGLQKLNFGSASIFRPLMWFDKVDPRDPLQLTDGVYGLLARFYFSDNANVWLWALYGNDDPKGWEAMGTVSRSVEFGGRVQIPVTAGELGATYHHRQADFILSGHFDPPRSHVPENRFALDGKWDIGIGAWFEAAITHEDIMFPALRYQRQVTLGADYTFDVGNGLTALTEYFRSDNPTTAFGSAAGVGLSALSMNYPLNMVDRMSCIIYRDWSQKEWYRLISWQRTYDNWIVYLLGFWNPKEIGIYRSQETSASRQSALNLFGGTGIQFMIVFNH